MLYFHDSRQFHYRAMLCRVRYCYGKSSLRPSVTLRYRDHVGWNKSKTFSRLVSLMCSLSADPNIMDPAQNFGRNRGGVWGKNGLWHGCRKKCCIARLPCDSMARFVNAKIVSMLANCRQLPQPTLSIVLPGRSVCIVSCRGK